MDGYDLYKPAHVLYIRTSGNAILMTLSKNMEFVINLTTKDMAFATDWCGVRSGRDYHKFDEMKLTPGQCTVVSAR